MKILALIKEVGTGRLWIEDYQVHPDENPLEWARRVIEIWNNGKSKYDRKRTVVLIRKLPDASFVDKKRVGVLPWEINPKKMIHCPILECCKCGKRTIKFVCSKCGHSLCIDCKVPIRRIRKWTISRNLRKVKK